MYDRIVLSVALFDASIKSYSPPTIAPKTASTNSIYPGLSALLSRQISLVRFLLAF